MRESAERDRNISPAAGNLPGSTVIIGAGPAGLSAGYELSKAGRPVCVLEKDPFQVGGLSRTIEFKQFRFDIGGHRFYSKNPAIESLWTEILGDRMPVRKRLSRIYYRGRLFKYPLDPIDALRKLGLREAIACLASYAFAPRRRADQIRSFEDWVSAAFGRRLYRIFFKTYTERVWGMPCTEISADWAAQRIKGLSMAELVRRVFARRDTAPLIKTLIGAFRYPPHGPGEMWDEFARRIECQGGTVKLGQDVVALRRAGGRLVSITAKDGGQTRSYPASNFISTMPIRGLIEALDPPPPAAVLEAARRLRYRDFLVVALVLDQERLFPDQWIYVHDPGVRVARIQNFKNWSPEMVPDPRFTLVGLEYFCSDGDEDWAAKDDHLIALASHELAALGLAKQSQVVDGTVVRQRAAYPVYDRDYQAIVSQVRDFISRELPNLQLVGRNGMHKYNNQDHAMMTGLMAARNIMGASFDLWSVNSDAEYLEGERDGDSGLRMTPVRLS